MDAVTLVENQIEDGQWLIDQFDKEGIVVRAACWVKPVDEDRWSLYIATPSMEEKGPLAAYGQIIPALQSLGDDWITGSDVMLVGEKHPLVRDALDILRRFPHSDSVPAILAWRNFRRGSVCLPARKNTGDDLRYGFPR
jgi:hypothetical protein